MRGRRHASAVGAALALVVMASCVLGFVSARPAKADTAYRYWAFYIANASTWSYSSRGPVAEHPVDGEVQGWRFAVQLDRQGELTPRTPPNFDQLCGSTPAASGKLRVGIVLDFGTAADAPAGETPPARVVTGCVQVASGSSGADVLQAAVGPGHLRVGNTGLVCGIDGYPKTECAPAVNASRPTPAPTPPTAPTPTMPATGKTTRTPTTSARAGAATATSTDSSSDLATPRSSLTAQAKSPASNAPTSNAPASNAPASNAPASNASTAASDSRAGGGSAAALSSLQQKSSTSHGFPLAAVAGAVLVVGLGVAAFVKARR